MYVISNCLHKVFLYVPARTKSALGAGLNVLSFPGGFHTIERAPSTQVQCGDMTALQ
jgi:hypothetical protein